MRRCLAVLPIAALLCAACATPVGVTRESPREVQRDLTESALSSDRPSAASREFLTRLGLRQRFDEDPARTLAEIHAGLAPEGDVDRLFALAELSFLYAGKTQRTEHALAAAVYAYAFLFAGGAPLDPFDPRVQIARNVYNRGLTFGIRAADPREIAVESKRYALPFGTLDVLVRPDDTTWVGWQLDHFLPAADYRVRGLANRYRHPGIGAPLTASLGKPISGAAPPGAEYIPPRLKVPVTAFLRLPDVRSQIARGQMVGNLELYMEDERTKLEVDGMQVPLEVEKSSSLAQMLEGAPIWDFGLAGFRLGDYVPGAGETERLVFMHPYEKGKIPLVVVHGTFSSPATWTEVVNELENDPEISTRYQIWLFLYNTGNPIAYSGGMLVQALRHAEDELDPQHVDPAMRHMVVVGHSQGGLLTKLTVVDSGDAFWRNISKKPFDEVQLAPESRALLRQSLFYERLPFVTRVVFMSTPHRGSYLSDYRVASWISRLVKMPVRIAKLTIDLATRGSDEAFLVKLDRPPTSLDNMASKNPFLRTLSELPIDPGVKVNSMIAVRGGQSRVPDGADGVVKYKSAHIEPVESELVVDSGHSVQLTPQGVQELRRILLLHAGVTED